MSIWKQGVQMLKSRSVRKGVVGLCPKTLNPVGLLKAGRQVGKQALTIC